MAALVKRASRDTVLVELADGYGAPQLPDAPRPPLQASPASAVRNSTWISPHRQQAHARADTLRVYRPRPSSMCDHRRRVMASAKHTPRSSAGELSAANRFHTCYHDMLHTLCCSV